MCPGGPAQVGKYGPGQPADFSGERVARSVAESMERLGVAYIDVILVHDVEYIDDLQKARAPAARPPARWHGSLLLAAAAACCWRRQQPVTARSSAAGSVAQCTMCAPWWGPLWRWKRCAREIVLLRAVSGWA